MFCPLFFILLLFPMAPSILPYSMMARGGEAILGTLGMEASPGGTRNPEDFVKKNSEPSASRHVGEDKKKKKTFHFV